MLLTYKFHHQGQNNGIVLIRLKNLFIVDKFFKIYKFCLRM